MPFGYKLELKSHMNKNKNIVENIQNVPLYRKSSNRIINVNKALKISTMKTEAQEVIAKMKIINQLYQKRR